jgi:hypothetical protein
MVASSARGLGKKRRVGHDSVMAAAIGLWWTSARDWVLKITLVLRFLSTFNHSRMRAAKSG